MKRILKVLHWNTSVLHLDDIIVTGRTFNEHLENLATVLQGISMAGPKLSVKTYEFFQKQVKYLGHLFTADGISADEGKIRAVNY